LFGPVTAVVPSGDDEAMRVANDTPDHLPAAVFGRHTKDQHGASTPGFATCYGRPCRFGGKIRRPRARSAGAGSPQSGARTDPF